MHKIAAMVALCGLTSVGCDAGARDENDCANGIAGFQTNDLTNWPLSIEELPDNDAMLSSDIDLYVSSIKHSQWRTYTLPKAVEPLTIVVSKTGGFCGTEDSLSIIDYAQRPLVDIQTEDARFGCRGWAKLTTVGDNMQWQLIEFGGDARP